MPLRRAWSLCREEAIARRIWKGEVVPAAEVIVTNVRHKHALERAASAVALCRQADAEGATEEILAEEIRAALAALGEITGDTATDDVIDCIFDRFCIGK